MSYDDIDSIIEQGKALGTHVFIYTGGEPLVRKHDLIKLCEAHPDCAFLCFTNATLIDETFCQDMIRVANFVPAISAEGFEEATDARAVKVCSRRCRRPWRCFASMACRSAFHAAIPLRMRAQLRLKNTSIGLSTRVHCSRGSSRSCL